MLVPQTFHPRAELLMTWEPGTLLYSLVQQTHQGCVAAGLASHPVTACPESSKPVHSLAAGVNKDSDTQGEALSTQRQHV